MSLSFNAYAEVCRYDYTHDNLRIDGTFMYSDEFLHEIWMVNGTEPILATYDGNARRFMWWDTVCPSCKDLKVRTIDRNGQYLKWVAPICNPPTQPIICQQ